MALNSINTNIAAYYAQSNIGKASTSAGLSIARLSSGERIVRAADDVAALSAGTSLRTNVTTLRTALVNTSQGASLLQVADGALGQIVDILQRQKAIAVQAGSGSLSASERGFLDQEFQNLTQEIDRLVDQTNFNGVTLLDGTLAERVNLALNGNAATQGQGGINFITNIAATKTIVIGGVTLTAQAAPTNANEFTVGATLQQTVDNLVTTLNNIGIEDIGSGGLTEANILSISRATYSRDGNSLVIKMDAGGTAAQQLTVDYLNSTALNAATVNSTPDLKGHVSRALLYTAGNIQATSINSVVTAAAGTLAAPFKVGDTPKIDLDGGGAAFAATALLSGAGTFAANQTLVQIVNDINTRTAIHGATARIVGTSGNYNIELVTTTQTGDGQYDAAGNSNINLVASGITAVAGLTLLAAGNTTAARTFYVGGADDVGIGAADTLATGSIGNSLITAQNQSKSNVQVIFPNIADSALVTNLNAGGLGNQFGLTFATAGAVAGSVAENVLFRFSTNADGDRSNTEAAIGSTLTESLDNLVGVMNNYFTSVATESQAFSLNQVRARRDGNSIFLESVDNGTVNNITGAALNVVAAGTFAASVSITNGGNLNNGSTLGGINTSGVLNSGFTGTVQGFTATYTGVANRANISIVVGGKTYTATNVNTAVTTNTTVRLTSQDGGGYFDMQFAANQGTAVASQADANTLANRMNAAFESVVFYQRRTVSSYNGTDPIITNGSVTGSLLGSRMELQSSNFSDVRIDSINVVAPTGSSTNGSITVTINGVEYLSAATVGKRLGAYQTYSLVSANNANDVLYFTTGNTAIQFDTQAKADSFEQALRVAFGVSEESASLKFQVGTTTQDTLQISVSDANTSALFGGQSINVLTAVDAATASDVLDAAIDAVTSIRADVGALQSRFDFAAANVESAIQNQDAARGVLLDTDIASESTAFATSQVQLQAGIAVLAQANLLPQNLLKLIG